MMHIDAHCAHFVPVQCTCTCTYPFRDVQYVHPNECTLENSEGRIESCGTCDRPGWVGGLRYSRTHRVAQQLEAELRAWIDFCVYPKLFRIGDSYSSQWWEEFQVPIAGQLKETQNLRSFRTPLQLGLQLTGANNADPSYLPSASALLYRFIGPARTIPGLL